MNEHIDTTRDDLKGNQGMWGGGNFWKFDYAFPNAPGLIIAVNTETGDRLPASYLTRCASAASRPLARKSS